MGATTQVYSWGAKVRGISRTVAEYFGEFRARFAGRHFGKYRAIVTVIDDPEMLGRVKVTCPRVFGDVETGWCWPASGYGSTSQGAPHGQWDPPSKGDMVWLEFEEGNVDRAGLWSHGAFARTAMADHGRGLPDLSDEGGLKGIEGAPVPGPNFAGTYGTVHSWQTPSGSFFEMDDAPGRERVQVHHTSGAHVEILADGTVNICAAGNVNIQASAGSIHEYASNSVSRTTEGNVSEAVGGTASRTVAGGSTTAISGLEAESSGGRATTIEGDWARDVRGSVAEQCFGHWKAMTGGQFAAFAGQDILLQSARGAVLAAMNSPLNNGLPTQDALTLQGFNGKALLGSYDATGIALESSLELDAALGTAVLTSLLRVALGSVTAVDPVVKWNEFSALILALTGWLNGHTHSSSGSGPPVVPADLVVTPVLTTACASLKVFVDA